MNKKCSCLVIVALSFVLSGCAGSQARYTSNVVEFLYPDKKVEEGVERKDVPPLVAPFKLGIAFVPDATSTVSGAQRRTLSLSEQQKGDLMGKIASVVDQHPFVRETALIPSQYLVPKGAFGNLDQLRAMYGIDVILLMSYDQLQHTDEGALSIMYWTLIGAYVVSGEKNDTSTMIDAAAFYIPSRKMIFRASGNSHVKASATLVNLSEQLRKDSYAGFEKAADDLGTNLQEQLALFEATLNREKQEQGSPSPR